MEKIPTNTDKDGCAVCIKANYKGMSGANFKPQVGGEYAATGVIEIVYEEDCDSTQPDA